MGFQNYFKFKCNNSTERESLLLGTKRGLEDECKELLRSSEQRYKNIKVLRDAKRPRGQAEDPHISIPEGPQKNR